MSYRLLLACVSTTVIAFSVVRPSAQQTTIAEPAAPMAFEAASIRPNKSGDVSQFIRRQPGGRMTVTNMPLRQLITFAFQLQQQQLVGGPSWIANDRFDIVAKMEGDPAPVAPGAGPDPLMLAMRTLLTERFKLVFHKETRELDVYALTLARSDGKLGAAIKPSTTDCETLMAGRRGGGPPPPPPDPNGPVVCGLRGSFGRIQMGGFLVSEFARSLQGLAGRLVLDRTGLKGPYDLELTFAQDRPIGPLPPGVDVPPADPNAPNVFTALQEQLGLKLESTKAPIEVMVIDSVEQPSLD
jgi:bla regulator protein blaR1